MADEKIEVGEVSVPQESQAVDLKESGPVQAKGWFKGALGMAICCAAPLLLFAAIASFGLSLGAIASGALSVVALLACPVGMFLMMRMMMKGNKEDQSAKK